MSDLSVAIDPRVGSRLASRYRVEARIARGGMASVYRARDEVLGRDVAVKIMHSSLADDPTFAERFRREAQAAARLSHPNVVAVYDCGEEAGDSFIVMELVEGTTLRSLLDRFGRLDTPTVRHVARAVAAALDHAHAKGLVHRDVKPENVLVTPNGHVKVVDFGIAKALGPQAARLTSDRPLGTVAYVAPEQLTGGAVDARADVYALGAMPYDMITGRPPAKGDTPHAVAAHRLQEPTLSPGVSAPIDGAVMKATASRPDDRFDTAGEFARALGDGAAPTFLVSTDNLPPPNPLPPLDPPAPSTPEPETRVLPLQARLRRRARRRFRVISVHVLLAAVGGGAAYVMSPKAKAIPDLRGQTLDEARAALMRQGLTVGEVEDVFHDIAPKGTIVSTDPRPGTEVREGTTLRLAVSKGPELFAVPAVVGKPVADAKTLMETAGFSLAVSAEHYNDTVPAGAIIVVEPKLEKAKRGTAFTAIVSRGPQMISVPDVDGESPESAGADIRAAGFAYGTVEEYSDTVEAGRVIRTSPAGGSLAPKGSRVTAFVSKGPRPFPMPNFVGMSLDDAKKKAKSVGLVVRNEYAVPGSGKKPGQVQGQNPPAGTSVRKGTAIDLYYST